MAAFFQNDDNFVNLELASNIVHDAESAVFACQDGTVMNFTGLVTYANFQAPSSQISFDVLDYLYRTRNTYAAFLRELGWEDLDKVFILTKTGKSFDGSVLVSENTESESRNSLIIVVAIVVPSFAVIVLVLVIIICRQKRFDNEKIMDQEEQQRCGGKYDDMYGGSVHGKATRNKRQQIGNNSIPSSSSYTGSGTSEEEQTSIPLNQEPKSRNNNLLESTVTVATHDMSSVSLSRVLGSKDSSFSEWSCSEDENDAEHHSTITSVASNTTSQRNAMKRQLSGTLGVRRQERGLSPLSDCRGMMKRSPIYQRTEARVTLTRDLSVKGHERGLSPQSDCRGLLKRPNTYKYQKEKKSSAPEHTVTSSKIDALLECAKAEILRSKSASVKGETNSVLIPQKKEPFPSQGLVERTLSSTSLKSSLSSTKSLGLTGSKMPENESSLLLKSAVDSVDSSKDMDDKDSVSSSYIPAFMMSFSSALSVSSRTSFGSKSATASQQSKHFKGTKHMLSDTSSETSEEDSKNISSETELETTFEGIQESKSDANKSKSSSVHRRYSFAKKEQLIKKDVEVVAITRTKEEESESTASPLYPIERVASCPLSQKDSDSNLDEQASIDPIISVSQSSHLEPSSVHDGNSTSVIADSVDENATDYSAPERVVFFGK